MSANPNFFPAANLALSGYSLFSGANDEARMNRNQIQSNNLQLGYLDESKKRGQEAYQGMLDVAQENFSNQFNQMGQESGMLWDSIDRTMSETLDTSKFNNYAQFDSNLDTLSRQNRLKFKSGVENMQIQREKAKGQAEEFLIGTNSTIDNQKKLLKLQNQQLKKNDSLWENLNPFG